MRSFNEKTRNAEQALKKKDGIFDMNVILTFQAAISIHISTFLYASILSVCVRVCAYVCVCA